VARCINHVCQDETAPDAGLDAPDGGDASPGGGRTGAVDFGRGSTYAAATFITTTSSPYTCTTKILPDANCSWVHCAGNLTGTPTTAADSAGTITISGGAKTVTLTPDAMNAYAPYFDATTPAWSAGQMITIAAAGGTVPAFTAMLAAPTTITLSSPAVDAAAPGLVPFTIDRSTPLALAWSGGTVGNLIITINGPEGATSTTLDNISCTFPAASGSGSVPVEALMRLPAGTQGAALGLSAADTTVVTAGAYAVTLTTYTNVINSVAGNQIILQ
jgi:hypothetical protein